VINAFSRNATGFRYPPGLCSFIVAQCRRWRAATRAQTSGCAAASQDVPCRVATGYGWHICGPARRSFAPLGAQVGPAFDPRLTPWATFCRRFAASAPGMVQTQPGSQRWCRLPRCFGTLVLNCRSVSTVGSRLPLGFRALVQNCRHTAAQFAGRFLRPRTEGPQQM